MKKQNGITLIALIITIIVLLILAGVSISLVVGQNGVLNKSQNAVSSTKLATAQEQATLAWGSCETDYLAYGRGQEKSTYFTISKLNENLSEGEVTEVSYGINAAGDSEFTYKVTERGTDTYYKMKVTAAGAVSVIGEPTTTAPTLTPSLGETKKTLASQIDASNYGDYVNYNKDLGLTLNLEGETTTPTTDWRIFYEDTAQDRVYLIAADFVPNTSSLLKISNAGMTAYGDYSLYWWENIPTKLSTNSRQDSVFGLSASSYTLKESNGNSICVSTLLDTNIWSDFVDTTVADYAIGGPTLEMFANSWNAKGYTTITPSSDNTSYGYKINGTNKLDVSTNTGCEDNLYFSHLYVEDGERVGTEACGGYWLAATSAQGVENMIVVDEMRSINASGWIYSDRYASVRPIIALKPGIEATKDANGVWQFGE